MTTTPDWAMSEESVLVSPWVQRTERELPLAAQFSGSTNGHFPGFECGDCPTYKDNCLNKNRKNKNPWVEHTSPFSITKIQLQVCTKLTLLFCSKLGIIYQLNHWNPKMITKCYFSQWFQFSFQKKNVFYEGQPLIDFNFTSFPVLNTLDFE